MRIKRYTKPAMAASMIAGTMVLCETMTRPHLAGDFTLAYFAFNYLPLLVLWGLAFAVTNKTLLSSLVSSLVAIGFVAVNNLKYSVLDKPLMPSDFLLLPQIFDDPELYLKYLNGNTYFCLAAVVIVAISLYRLEMRQLPATKAALLGRVAVIGITVASLVSITNADSLVARKYATSPLRYACWDPKSSVKSSGLFSTFIRMSGELDFAIPENYGDPALIEKIAGTSLAARKKGHLPATLPDIVVVQSESFYDVRQHDLAIDGAPYADFDQAATNAAVRGRLGVETVAGNTVKTEFSFLTGIETSILPAGCEYPYRNLVRKNIWSIAWYLKSLGYQTIAIHPNKRTFWDRNIALPFLGFDQFIDGDSFTVEQREGLFVSDQAVFEKIMSVKKRATSPCFIFAITMENHGPWNARRVRNQRKFAIKGNLNANEKKKLARYLHHVVNAGRMALRLKEEVEKSDRPFLFAFYGDHCPGLGDILKKAQPKPGRSITETPYLIVRNFGLPGHQVQDTSVGFLASQILDEAGINNDPYFLANSYIEAADGGIAKRVTNYNEIKKSYTQLLYDNLAGNLPNVRFVD